LFSQTIKIRRAQVLVAVTAKGVKALLVSADPQDVWFFHAKQAE
jgi:hypothetical protein